MSVFTEVDGRQESYAIKWLAAAMTGAPKFTRHPTVVVVTDEQGKEMARSSYGEVSEALQDMVDQAFPIT